MPTIRCCASAACASGERTPLGWFALDYDHPRAAGAPRAGGATCGVRDGRLIVVRDGTEHDLGAIAAMPLTVGGSADYNIANVAGAALAALALGVPPPTSRAVLARFGADPADNPGRLSATTIGVRRCSSTTRTTRTVCVACCRWRALQRDGRLALLLGQAGNREDGRHRATRGDRAAVRPDSVVVKETEAYLRGRAPGEVAGHPRGGAAARGRARRRGGHRADASSDAVQRACSTGRGPATCW